MGMGSLKSKKLIVAMLAAVGIVANALAGHPVDDETMKEFSDRWRRRAS